MVRIRHGWLVAALAAPLCLGLVACKKEEKKADPAAAAQPGEAPAEKPATTPGTVAPGSNADDLSLLPADSDVVVGLNFAQLQKSSLWKKFVEPQLMKGDAQQKFGEFKAKCGFDPLAAVTNVSLGLKGVTEDKPDGVIVVHGPQKAQVLGCLEKMKDEAAKDGSEITRDGDIVTIKSDDGTTVVLTYTNDTTLLAVVGPNATADGIAKVAQGGSALKTSDAFVEMYGKINTQDSLWLLMNGKAKAFDQAAQMGFKPQAVFGSVNVTDGLSLDLRVRLDTAEKAAQLAATAKGQVAQFTKMVDKVDITNDGADVKVNVAMSTQKLEALVQQFGALLGIGAP